MPDTSKAFDEPRNQKPCLFVMLNPSTADGMQDDNTITRCSHFADDWGFTSLVIANIFALRSTDPAALYTERDPVGPDNDAAILSLAGSAGIVVAAWGNHGTHKARGTEVLRMIRGKLAVPIHHLGMTSGTKKGRHRTEPQPRHPLYLRSDTKPIPFGPTV